MFATTVIIIIASTILIISALLHPEIVNEQYGVISREKSNTYDYLIMSMFLILLFTVMYSNYVIK